MSEGMTSESHRIINLPEWRYARWADARYYDACNLSYNIQHLFLVQVLEA